MKKLLPIIMMIILSSCSCAIPFLTSPAVIEAEDLIVHEAEHELNPNVPAPVSEK